MEKGSGRQEIVAYVLSSEEHCTVYKFQLKNERCVYVSYMTTKSLNRCHKKNEKFTDSCWNNESPFAPNQGLKIKLTHACHRTKVHTLKQFLFEVSLLGMNKHSHWDVERTATVEGWLFLHGYGLQSALNMHPEKPNCHTKGSTHMYNTHPPSSSDHVPDVLAWGPHI